jgi:hypothetical protein
MYDFTMLSDEELLNAQRSAVLRAETSDEAEAEYTALLNEGFRRDGYQIEQCDYCGEHGHSYVIHSEARREVRQAMREDAIRAEFH